MTTPKVQTVTVNGDRWYVDPNTGERVPGVSSIKDVLGKPGLLFGAVKAAAEYAVDNAETISALAATDRKAAIDLVKRAHVRAWAAKSSSGTGVHAIAEDLLKGRKGIKVSPEQRKFIVHYARFYKRYKVKPLFIETTVFNFEVGYAGTFDSIIEITLNNGEAKACGLPGAGTYTVLVDIKTGASGIWAETSLQQVAYARAEKMVLPDGSTIPVPHIDAAFALWLRPEGYALIPLDIGDETWDAFRGLRVAYGWTKTVQPNAVLPALNEDAIQKRWRPS